MCVDKVDAMKLFQIFNNVVYYEMTGMYESLKEARSHYAPDIQIEEAPDYVFPGWSFDGSKQGDERFVQPIPGDGQAYNPETGEIWDPEEARKAERRQLHSETTDDTMEAYRKLRQGDKTIDWQSWLDTLDAYNVAIEETKNQEGYPLKVTYPEYPTKPTA